MSSDISVWAKGLHFVEEKTGLDLDGDGMVGSEEPERPDDIKVTLTATLGGAGAAIPLRGVVSSARGLQTYDAPGGTFLGALPVEMNVAVLKSIAVCANIRSSLPAISGRPSSLMQPYGVWPECLDIVPCEGPLDLGTSLDASTCSTVASDGTCSLSCASGYAKGSAEVQCPQNNVDRLTSVIVLSRMDCALIVTCAPMQEPQTTSVGVGVESINVDQCALLGGLGAGQQCGVIVVCEAGYIQANATKTSGVFSCPVDNTDANSEITGTYPQCEPCIPGQYLRTPEIKGAQAGTCETCPSAYTAGCDATLGSKMCPATMAAKSAAAGIEACNECEEFPARCQEANGMCEFGIASAHSARCVRMVTTR